MKSSYDPQNQSSQGAEAMIKSQHGARAGKSKVGGEGVNGPEHFNLPRPVDFRSSNFKISARAGSPRSRNVSILIIINSLEWMK